MRYLLIFFFAGLISSACAQKMYETGEWCAHSKNLFQPAAPLPNDTRSDSIDLTHAWITLDLTQVSSQKISGNCKWVFTPIVDQIAEIQFDLLALTVDSVVFNHLQVPFQRQGEKVVIPFSAPLSQGSIYDITIYYQGTPQKDASDWGGFYFSGNYAFNLGVGFAADPHVFGRAWFPCFDNFEERSTYTFDMYTTPAQPAYCNGYLLTDETTPDNKRRRLWLMNQSIPSYLACVAIGPYTSFTRTYQGVNNPIPVEIAAAAADTNKVRTTFIHLPDAIKAYEHWFGPYKWHKIGYSLVPFNSGAMEHATNVAIGRTFINGSLNYETLWAHELSHHWWGDLATCTTAEDMWLNEGWASFSEHLFTEWVYGRAAYIAAVKSNFLNVLQNAHVGEGGYRAVSGVPHNLTYGTHVYNKGAVVAHNLRAYMGDSLFRIGIRSALDQTNFTDWSSADFRDKLELATGLDLHPFFNDWVFNGGYPDFVIDSIHTSATGQQNLQVKVFLKQKRRGTPAFHQSVPLELTAVDQNGQKMNFLTTISGEYGSTTLNFNASQFVPSEIWVNANGLLMQARSDVERWLKTTGANNLSDVKFNMTVNALGADSVLIRVEHHFAEPDGGVDNPNNYALSTRFWTVSGLLPPGFNADAVVFYDGRGQADLLDRPLFDATGPAEDNLVLLFRPDATHVWQEFGSYTRTNIGTNTDKFGQFKITGVLPGQYTIGKTGIESGVQTVSGNLGKVQAYPNPTMDELEIKAENEIRSIQIVNSNGVMVKKLRLDETASAVISLKSLPVGFYWLIVEGKKGTCIVSVQKQ